MGLLTGTVFDRPPHCEVCDRLESECTCPPPEPHQHVYAAPETQTARVSIEKRRKGKVVTVVAGLNADQTDLSALLTRLKSECGAGGTMAEGDLLEVQGNQLDRVMALLRKIGYRVKG